MREDSGRITREVSEGKFAEYRWLREADFFDMLGWIGVVMVLLLCGGGWQEAQAIEMTETEALSLWTERPTSTRNIPWAIGKVRGYARACDVDHRI